MKQLKIFGALAMVAMALSGFIGASAASATALYNGTTKLGVGSTTFLSLVGVIRITNTAGTETLDEWTGASLRDSLTNAGGAGVAAQASISELSWTGCSVPTATDTLGGLEVTQIGTSTEGTVRANSEIGWTTNSIFFGICKYGVEKGSHLGVIKTTASGTASFTGNATIKKLSGSNFACPETERWIFIFASTNPDNLRVEAS